MVLSCLLFLLRLLPASDLVRSLLAGGLWGLPGSASCDRHGGPAPVPGSPGAERPYRSLEIRGSC